MSNPFDAPDDGTNPFFMTESEQNHKSLIDFGDDQTILIPSSSPVSYPPMTSTPTTQSVNLIDIGDTPKPPQQLKPQQQQQQPAPKKEEKKVQEEDEEIVFSFEPIPAAGKDFESSNENSNLLGNIDDVSNQQQQQQQQSQQQKKKSDTKKKSQQVEEDEEEEEGERKWYHMFYKISFYRKYFNVDTVDVGERIWRSLVPIKNFFEVAGENPDLYGTFWITTTLLFALAISSNFSNYISYWMAGRENEWGYNFMKVTVGAAVLYTYVGLSSIAVWLTQKYWFKHSLSLVSCLSIYGYSLSSYVVGTLFCMIPVEWLRWGIIIFCFLISGIFIGISFYTEFKSFGVMKNTVLLSCVGVVHFALALVYKLYFFGKVTLSTPSP